MSLINFLKCKVFLKQIGWAIFAIVVLSFVSLKWLKYSTNHGQFIEVPMLKGKTLDVVEMELNDKDLQMMVQDSANYNPDYPKYSVIDQQPEAGFLVKEHRKIYLTINPSCYRKVAIPNITRRTLRQAQPVLEALGFVIGKISYVNDIGKNEVLAIKYKGETVVPGTLLEMTTIVDLVLGNGDRSSN